jgi:hypothetical protein
MRLRCGSFGARAAMKIRLSDPSLVDDLLAFLRAKQCVVESVSADTLDVELPEVLRSDAAALELDLYLRVFEATHPGLRVTRVDEGRPSP